MLEEQIERISKLRMIMWPPEESALNITEIDHLIATLTEELGEFRGAVRSFLGRPYSPEKTATKADMIKELGDMLVPIIGLANHSNITIQEALASAEVKLTFRAQLKKVVKTNTCTDCQMELGGQHRPSCHRQGLVTSDSVYHNDQ